MTHVWTIMMIGAGLLVLGDGVAAAARGSDDAGVSAPAVVAMSRAGQQSAISSPSSGRAARPVRAGRQDLTVGQIGRC